MGGALVFPYKMALILLSGNSPASPVGEGPREQIGGNGMCLKDLAHRSLKGKPLQHGIFCDTY